MGVDIERENTIGGVCRRPPQETFHFGLEAVGGYDGKCIYMYLKGQSQLWDRADLDTTFVSLKRVYLNPKSNEPVGYI